MKKKTKIIVFSSILAVVILALVAVVLVFKLTKKSEESGNDIWKETPFIYESSEEETSFDSYSTPFADVIATFSTELDVKSKSMGKSLKILSAYTSDKGTPTMIIAYNNSDGAIDFLVCKFKDNKLYKTYIESSMTELSENNDIIMVKDSDILALRCNVAEENASQVIYDFWEGNYCAVKDNRYETGTTADMDETLKLYEESAVQWESFYALSVKENVLQSLNDFAGKSSS